MTTRANYLSLVRLAKKNGFNVTCPWDASYQKDMTIWNRRLQTGPAMVAFCKKTEDVQLCVNWCGENAFPLRVRSGGHHHEGMSCDYGVLIIDLSLMNTISYTKDPNQAWIPPGKQLQDVYAELEARKQIIPGGGCETVCVGGLTLGGGWGMYSRALGLTCDNILEAEIVMADSSVCHVKVGDPLFRALQGGGAGNFGIVTNLLFKLTNVSRKRPAEVITWAGPLALPAIDGVIRHIADDSFPRATTLACRLYREAGEICFKVTSQVLETQSQENEILRELTGNYPPTAKEDAGLLHFADSKIVNAPSSGPDDTCNKGPLPHKVSSAFVKKGQELEAALACYKFLVNNDKTFPNASTYISLHSFGGAIADKASDATAFPYRDRMLLLQFQAWWSDPADDSTDQYINWIKDARTNSELQDLTDGGFFNFQDASITSDRHDLMKYYYADNLGWLIDLKIQHDPTNVFQSGMSIPNKNKR